MFEVAWLHFSNLEGSPVQETSDGAQKHPPLWFPDLCSQDAPHVGCRALLLVVLTTVGALVAWIFPWPVGCQVACAGCTWLMGLSLTEADCRASRAWAGSGLLERVLYPGWWEVSRMVFSSISVLMLPEQAPRTRLPLGSLFPESLCCLLAFRKALQCQRMGLIQASFKRWNLGMWYTMCPLRAESQFPHHLALLNACPTGLQSLTSWGLLPGAGLLSWGYLKPWSLSSGFFTVIPLPAQLSASRYEPWLPCPSAPPCPSCVFPPLCL